MNILIVEDELQTATLLQEIIEQDSDFMVIRTLESVVETIQYLHKYQSNIDLLFFDIELADGRSFEIFKHVDVVVPVVFCTAYDEFTLQAIQNNGINYVLKPFKDKEIHEALQKYKRLIGNVQAKHAAPIHFQSTSTKQYQQHFISQHREKSIIIPVEKVALFTIENETLYLYTTDGKKNPLFKKLDYIESVCDPNSFFRVNRQMLVHRNAVRSFQPYFNRKIILELNVKAKESPVVSRLKVSAFKKWLEQ